MNNVRGSWVAGCEEMVLVGVNADNYDLPPHSWDIKLSLGDLSAEKI